VARTAFFIDMGFLPEVELRHIGTSAPRNRYTLDRPDSKKIPTVIR